MAFTDIHRRAIPLRQVQDHAVDRPVLGVRLVVAVVPEAHPGIINLIFNISIKCVVNLNAETLKCGCEDLINLRGKLRNENTIN